MYLCAWSPICLSGHKSCFGKEASAGDTGVNERAVQDSEAADSEQDICSFLETVVSLILYQTLCFIICCKRFLCNLF